MSDVIVTRPLSFKRLYTANTTATSITAPAKTTTKPTAATTGVIQWPQELYGVENIHLIPFGTDADGETMLAKVWGWIDAGGLYVPMLLSDLTITLGSAVGVAGEYVTASDFFADTIANTGSYTAFTTLQSPADNSAAKVVVNVRGFVAATVLMSVNGSSASNNCLYALEPLYA